MAEWPLVSVGITSYNRPDDLRRTLECIIGQTYENLEIILSDNCSPNPEIDQIGKEFEHNDSRVRYIRQVKNMGGKYNAGFVLSEATGEYFMWASDDDLWDKKFISSLMTALKQNPCASFAFCNIVNIDRDDNIIREYPSFSRFTNKNKWMRVCKFFLEPEIMGKANMFYSIFRRKFILNVVDSGCIENSYWGCDNCLVLGSLARSEFAIFEEVLFKKRIPVPSDKRGKPKMIVIDKPYRHSVPVSKFIGYTNNCIRATGNTKSIRFILLCVPIKYVISLYGFIYAFYRFLFREDKIKIIRRMILHNLRF